MPLSETVLTICVLLAVAMGVAALGRKLTVPYTVVLVIIGVALGEAGEWWPALSPLHHFRLSPDVVFFLFLPVLIFESGLSMNSRQLVKDLAPILMLAVLALLVSTAIIGAGLALLLDLDPIVALVFGALISATDPVAVIALFKELGAPARLTVLVEGESLLNDATAIVLFGILLTMAIDGVAPSAGGVAGAAFDFLRVFFGGIVAGVVLGVVVAEFLVRSRATTPVVQTMSLVLAYVAFVLAEHSLHVSGVMATAVAAVVFGGLGVSRMPQQISPALEVTWELAALICNSLLFLLVGLSISIDALLANGLPIAIAVGLVLAARAATVWTLVPISTRAFRLPKVTFGEQAIMWWGGLKGGLAIAIVLSIPDTQPWRDFLISLTLGVVLFTLLVNAPTIRPLMRKLGLDRLTADERAYLERGLADAYSEVSAMLDELVGAGGLTRTAAHRAGRSVRDLLNAEAPAVDRELRTRNAFASAMETELATLVRLRDIGLISQYTWLDMRSAVRREAELRTSTRADVQSADSGILTRLESLLVRTLREHDWAAGLFSAYQSARFSRQLRRDVGQIVVARAVLDMLATRSDLDSHQHDEVANTYQQRMDAGLARIAAIRREYRDFHHRFETRLAERAALGSASVEVQHRFQHAGLAAKPFTKIEALLQRAIEELPPVSEPLPGLETKRLIEVVPLLAGLPEQALESLAAHARPVTALANDIVIGEGEKGDALYIVTHGELAAIHQHENADTETLGELSDGDFFGEMALLGDQVRSATVRAITASTLLRLTRHDVLALAKRHPELAERLQQASKARREAMQ